MKLNVIWALIANFFYSGAQWAVLILMTKHTSLTAVGLFVFGASLLSPFVLLMNLKLGPILATDSKGEYQLSSYIATRTFTSVLVLFYVLMLILFNDYARQNYLIFILLGSAKIAESFGDILYGYMQRLQRIDLIAKSKALKALLQISIVYLAVTSLEKIEAAIFSIFLTMLLVTLFFDIPSCRRLYSLHQDKSFRLYRLRLDYKQIGQLVKIAFPMGIATGLGSLMEYVPRYFVKNYNGLEQVATFAAISTLLAIGSAVLGAIGLAVAPQLSNFYASNDIKRFDSVGQKLMIVGAAAGIVAVIIASTIGEEVIIYIYGNQLSNTGNIVLLLSVSFCFRATFVYYGTMISAMRKFNTHYKIDICMMIVLIIAIPLLSNFYRKEGVYFALICVALIEGICYFIAYRLIKKKLIFLKM